MKHLTTITLLIVTLMLSGCGQKLPDGMPKPYPVTITIIQDGKPLAGASVALAPKNVTAGQRYTAGAVTNTSGQAVIQTLSKYRGVIPGEYQITVLKTEFEVKPLDVAARVVPKGIDKDNPSLPKESVEGYYTVDMKYSTVSTTPESITVETKSNRKTIDVGKAVRLSVTEAHKNTN
ncbi:MAG: carboxypeptidase-like regulatory domain-containing protein [Planctomycetaceae bacterium]|jgi:hypothetical protein|nr:carboxypeptidase-like regulatory domain-containing protein [Planctomycetaceae bacterium]